MTIEQFEHRYQDLHKDKVRCPHCVMGSGPMSSLSIGYDPETGEIVHSGTRDICTYCGGTGWLTRCPTCFGHGGVKETTE